MLKKIFIILICNIKSDDETFKKKLHIYVGGYTKHLKKDNSIKCEIEWPSRHEGLTLNQNFIDIEQVKKIEALPLVNVFESPINPNFFCTSALIKGQIDHTQYMSHNIPKVYLVYHQEISKDEHTKLFTEAIHKSKEIKEKHIGAILSVYLFEFKEMLSCGLFIGTEHMAEDYVEFSPQVLDLQYRTETQEGLKPTPKQGKGIIFLKRRTPLIIGGFIQVQNADLDAFLYALKLNIGVGLTTIHALIKDTNSFANEKLITKQKILLEKKISLSLSASIILRYKDLEIFLIGGVSWIPKGISSQCVYADYQKTTINTRKNGYAPIKRIQKNSIVLNHLYVYIGIGLGWNFN